MPRMGVARALHARVCIAAGTRAQEQPYLVYLLTTRTTRTTLHSPVVYLYLCTSQALVRLEQPYGKAVLRLTAERREAQEQLGPLEVPAATARVQAATQYIEAATVRIWDAALIVQAATLCVSQVRARLLQAELGRLQTEVCSGCNPMC